MSASPASKRGWYPHRIGIRLKRRIKAAGWDFRTVGPHHYHLTGKGRLVNWWPSKGKFQLKNDECLMGNEDDLIEFLEGVKPVSACIWCENGWPVENGAHHLPEPAGTMLCEADARPRPVQPPPDSAA